MSGLLRKPERPGGNGSKGSRKHPFADDASARMSALIGGSVMPRPDNLRVAAVEDHVTS